jgi:probable rRNA maturation factor
MRVEIANEQDTLALNIKQIANIVATVIVAEGQRCDEVAVHFVTAEVIGELHQRFFGDPSPTDCISLPMDEIDDGSYRHLGEVFVCPQVACEYVKTQGEGDPLAEVCLYIVHGLLHLMGYDDVEEEAAHSMRQAEQRHLTILKEAGMLSR